MQISFSIEEASKVIGIGRTSLYSKISSGELPAKKLGKRTIILKEDLESFIETLQPYQPRKSTSLAVSASESTINHKKES